MTANQLNQMFNTDNLQNVGTDEEENFHYQNVNDKYYEVTEVNDMIPVDNNLNDFFTMCINIRGLNIPKNYIQLEAITQLLENRPHMIAINETFLREGEEGAFNNLDGYKLKTNCRKHVLK